jgi:hypothetical protein
MCWAFVNVERTFGVHNIPEISFDKLNAPIHTAGTVQSWFEEHDGELQHLPGQHNHHV